MLATPAFVVPVTVTISNYSITHNNGPDGLTINTQKILPEPFSIPGGLEPGGASL